MYDYFGNLNSPWTNGNATDMFQKEKIDPTLSKINTIKALREWGETTLTVNIGLKEAKDFIEVLIERQRKERLTELVRKALVDSGVSFTEYSEVKDTISW